MTLRYSLLLSVWVDPSAEHNPTPLCTSSFLGCSASTRATDRLASRHWGCRLTLPPSTTRVKNCTVLPHSRCTSPMNNRRFRSVTELTTKVRIGGRGYLWGSFLIAAAALKTPTRNGFNAQGVNLKSTPATPARQYTLRI